MYKWPPKDPDEILDYQMDWSERLVDGEGISTSTFLLVTGTVVIDSQSVSGALATIWLSGGTTGETCELTNRVVTDQGRTYDESVQLKIRSK